jgi:hypothetical protein
MRGEELPGRGESVTSLGLCGGEECEKREQSEGELIQTKVQTIR